MSDGLRWNWWDRFKLWFRERFTRRKCDSCAGRFKLLDGAHVSADEWLCSDCWEEHMQKNQPEIWREYP